VGELPNIGITIFPSYKQNGIRINFKEKEDKVRFLNIFKSQDFGTQATFLNADAQRRETRKPISNTTFTCVIKSIPTTVTINELKEFCKAENINITNATRIKNDRGPLPLIRLFTADPALVSHLITNGITIGFTRYRVEESKTAGRPLPCRTCLLYHPGQPCNKTPSCYRCGEAHFSNRCNIAPNKNYCGSCKAVGHRTAASNCPLRPQQAEPITPVKIYRQPPATTTLSYAASLQSTTTNNSQEPPSNTTTSQAPAPEAVSQNLLTAVIDEMMDKMMKWVSTVLTLSLSHETLPKVTSAIKRASEEIFNCRINVLQSVDGHICVTKEDFFKKQKTNQPLSTTINNSDD